MDEAEQQQTDGTVADLDAPDEEKYPGQWVNLSAPAWRGSPWCSEG
jgi:hypothetical protein